MDGWGGLNRGGGTRRESDEGGWPGDRAGAVTTCTLSHPLQLILSLLQSCVRKKLLKQTAKNSSDPSLEVWGVGFFIPFMSKGVFIYVFLLCLPDPTPPLLNPNETSPG